MKSGVGCDDYIGPCPTNSPDDGPLFETSRNDKFSNAKVLTERFLHCSPLYAIDKVCFTEVQYIDNWFVI